MRVGIVGAGAVGTSCGLYLQADGQDVEIFDELEPGAGASFGNSGVIADNEVIPLGRPETLRALPRLLLDRDGPLAIRWRHLPTLLPWFLRFALASRPRRVEQVMHQLANLLASSAAEWHQMLAGTSGSHLLRKTGWLKAHPSESSLRSGIRQFEVQSRFGISAEILTADRVRAIEPALSSIIVGGVFYPNVHSLASPFQAVQALASRFLRGGGLIHRERVVKIEEHAGTVWVHGQDATRKFDCVVIAAGAWSKAMARVFEPAPPLDTERGYHLMFQAFEPKLQRPVTIASPGYTVAPMVEGVRIASGVEFASLRAPPDYRRIDKIAAHARTVFPNLRGEPLSRWLGRRPSMPDSLPIIRPSERSRNVFFAFGHGHLGLTLAPVTGRMIAEFVRQRAASR
jgi:D-amino-acid dehydrogenase